MRIRSLRSHNRIQWRAIQLMLIRLAPLGSGMPRPDFPRTIIEFQQRFPDDQGCRGYLFASRWQDGFCCPRCGTTALTALPRRLLWQCSGCRDQVWVTAGTVLHKTHTPLHLWFWAAYLMSMATPGISASYPASTCRSTSMSTPSGSTAAAAGWAAFQTLLGLGSGQQSTS